MEKQVDNEVKIKPRLNSFLGRCNFFIVVFELDYQEQNKGSIKIVNLL